MSLLAAKKTFKVTIGTTFHYRFQWLIETKGEKIPQKLEEFTGTLPITPVGASVPWMTLTQVPNENGSGITFHGATGVIDLIIGVKDTEVIKWTSANYHFFVVQPAPLETIALLAGKFGALTL